MRHFLLLALCVHASAALPEIEANRYVDAIYRAEGGTKTRHPYGVLSVKVASAEEARQVCFRTVQNNHSRWLRAHSKSPFVDFLADRYCPPSADFAGNARWKKNVRYFLSK
jgi:hypothetical protein